MTDVEFLERKINLYTNLLNNSKIEYYTKHTYELLLTTFQKKLVY